MLLEGKYIGERNSREEFLDHWHFGQVDGNMRRLLLERRCFAVSCFEKRGGVRAPQPRARCTVQSSIVGSFLGNSGVLFTSAVELDFHLVVACARGATLSFLSRGGQEASPGRYIMLQELIVDHYK